MDVVTDIRCHLACPLRVPQYFSVFPSLILNFPSLPQLVFDLNPLLLLHDPGGTAQDSMSSISITTTEGFFLRDGLAALTTVFTPPASYGCETRWLYDYGTSPGLEGSNTVVSNYYPIDPLPTSLVLENNYFDSCSPFWVPATAFNPGICPSGHMIQKITESRQGTSRLWEAHCCPRYARKKNTKSARFLNQDSGMTIDGECVMTFTTPFTAIVALTKVGSRFWDYLTRDSNGEVIAYKNTTVFSSGTAYAHPLTIYWQSIDLSHFPSNYASSLATQMGVHFPSTKPAPGASTNIVQPTSTLAFTAATAKISTGTKAGIGVGSVLGAFVLVAAVFTILRLRRGTQKVYNSYPQTGGMPLNDVELEKPAGVTAAAEVDGNQLQMPWEADGRQLPVEIDSRNVKIIPGPPVELG